MDARYLRRSLAAAGLLAALAAPAGAQELPAAEARLEIRQILLDAQDSLQKGQDRKAMAQLFDALYNLANTAELFVTRAELTTAPAQRFGKYRTREHNAYVPGQPVHLYLEPLGMDFQRKKDGSAAAHVSVSYKLRDSSGAIVQQKDDFLTARFRGQTVSFDNFIAVTYRFGELPTGRYKLATILTDEVGGSRIAVDTELLIHGSAGKGGDASPASAGTVAASGGESGPTVRTGRGSLMERLFGGNSSKRRSN